MKFTSGIRTEKDYSFVMQNGKFVLKGETTGLSVFYNGKPVSHDAAIVSETKVLESNLDVNGVEGYALTLMREGNIVKFVIAIDGGEKFEFTV